MVIDLDTPDHQEVVLAISYRNVKTAISRARLLELLKREEEFLAVMTSSADRTATQSAATGPAFVVKAEKVTHASLSSRIKKIYDYSCGTKRLRAAHIGFLRDLVENFDWAIPGHPNTRLEEHLGEMLGWQGVTDEFKGEMERFLKKYREARGLEKPAGDAAKKR